MRFICSTTLAVFLGGLIAPATHAQTPDGATAEIQASIDSYIAAFNNGDVDAVLKHWAEDAEYLLATGERVQGREALRVVFKEAIGDGERPTIAIASPHIRLLSDTVATEEGVATLTSAGEEPEETTYLAIHVKKPDGWKLTTVRETETPRVELAPATEQLLQLEWLVGEWVDQSEEATVNSSVRWSGKNAFLVYTFKAARPGEDGLEGTQVIGWDPVDGVIRSWMFDSDGGFGDGVWNKDGDRWVVTFHQTLADGGQATATNVYTLVDANTYKWHSFQRTLNGEPLPSVSDITISRAPATAAEPAAELAPPAPETAPAR